VHHLLLVWKKLLLLLLFSPSAGRQNPMSINQK
jgi:hypothetical protein